MKVLTPIVESLEAKLLGIKAALFIFAKRHQVVTSEALNSQ